MNANEYAVLEDPELLFGRLGVALVQKTSCRITYGLDEREVEFTPSITYTIEDKLTCKGQIDGVSARIHIEPLQGTERTVAVITLSD